jgi:hypothetical protein
VRNGQSQAKQPGFCGVIVLQPFEIVHQFGADEHARISDRGQIQRIAGARINRQRSKRTLDLDRRGVYALHQAIDPHLAHISPEASHQRRGEVVRHRTAKLQALEAGRQAERLPFPDRDDEVPLPRYLIQHHAVKWLLSQWRSEPDDFGDSHLDEADICSRTHRGFPSLATSSMVRLTATAAAGLTPREEKNLARLNLGRIAEQRGEGRCDRGEEAAVLREGPG